MIDMAIGRGIVRVDDYNKFGRMYDELGKYASIITYVPKGDKIIVVVRDEFVDTVAQILEEYGLTVKEISKGKGVMRFIKTGL